MQRVMTFHMSHAKYGYLFRNFCIKQILIANGSNFVTAQKLPLKAINRYTLLNEQNDAYVIALGVI